MGKMKEGRRGKLQLLASPYLCPLANKEEISYSDNFMLEIHIE